MVLSVNEILLNYKIVFIKFINL